MRRLVLLLALGALWPGGLGAELRIATLNIAKKHGAEVLARIKAEPDLQKADILLLQEVVDGNASHMAAEIGAALGLHVAFAPAFPLDNEFQEGLAILSRYELSPPLTIPLPHNELHFHNRVRIAIASTAQTPGGPVRVINLHLDNRINADAKREQLNAILAEADRMPGPCIVGGDFNNGNFLWKSHVLPLPGLQSLRRLTDEEMERHKFHTPLGSGPATLRSGAVKFLRVKLDWIYLRDLKSGDSGVTPIPFSDHNAVWVGVP